MSEFGCIVQGTVLEHGDEDSQPAVAHAAECARVIVAPDAQASVVLAGRGIVLNARPRPVIDRLPKATLARIAHVDEPRTFATALRHRRDAHERAQRGIIACSQGPTGLREHRGGHDSSDAW